jgi:uncharacterized membrane protein
MRVPCKDLITGLSPVWCSKLIINLFSCRIYGLRKYKKQIREDDEICLKPIK